MLIKESICGSDGKESACNAGNPGSITGLGREWLPTLVFFPLEKREKLPTPVFWPGEFHGLYSPWGCKESDTTKRLSLSLVKRQRIPGEFHGQRSRVGGRPQGHKESDMTEQLTLNFIQTLRTY